MLKNQKYPNRLGEWRDARELTQEDMAARASKKTKISVSHYKKLERGERQLTPKWLRVFSDILGISADDLLMSSSQGRQKPRGLAAATASTIQIAEWDFKAGLGDGEVLATEHPIAHWSAPLGYFGRQGALVIIDTKGDSMQPTLVAGDRVVIDQADRDPSQGGMFAIWDGYGVKVKRVETIAQSKPRKIRVLSENPVYPPDELVVDDATILGRVVGLIRRFM
jgi:phage repressor protein C with HTH and peptisase S24 domain